MQMIEKTRWGLKSRNQLPLFMVWREYRYGGEVEYASVLFSTHNWWVYVPMLWRSHGLSKLAKTLRIATTLVLARTFGTYCYSAGGAGEPDYAVYHWRGKRWCFPTHPLENE